MKIVNQTLLTLTGGSILLLSSASYAIVNDPCSGAFAKNAIHCAFIGEECG